MKPYQNQIESKHEKLTQLKNKYHILWNTLRTIIVIKTDILFTLWNLQQWLFDKFIAHC